MLKTDIARVQLPGGQTIPVYTAYEKTKIRLLLETAGPVAYGCTQANMLPTGVNGDLLITNLWTNFILAPGQILYMASGTPQTIGFIKEDVDYPDVENLVRQLIQAIYVLINTAQGNAKRGAAKPDGC